MGKKRTYEYITEQTTIDDNDFGHLDKSGYPRARKFKFSTLYNYIKTKLDLVYQTILVSGTSIKTVNNESLLGSGNIEISGTDKNIATNDLLFTTNSTTDFAGYKGTFDNAELKIIADGNTSGDVPFEVTQANGTDTIFKILGDREITQTTGLSKQITINYTALKSIEGNGESILNLKTTADNKSLTFTINYFGNAVIQNSTGQLSISTSSNLNLIFNKLNLSGLPTSASGLSAGDVWNNGGILTIV
jgi:hypothetical protein